MCAQRDERDERFNVGAATGVRIGSASKSCQDDFQRRSRVNLKTARSIQSTLQRLKCLHHCQIEVVDDADADYDSDNDANANNDGDACESSLMRLRPVGSRVKIVAGDDNKSEEDDSDNEDSEDDGDEALADARIDTLTTALSSLPINEHASAARACDPKWIEHQRRSKRIIDRQNYESIENAMTKLAPFQDRPRITESRQDEVERLMEERMKLLEVEKKPSEEAQLLEAKMKPLTKSEQKRVKQLWDAPASKIIISKFNVDLSAGDLKCLRDGVWLNDEVINFHISMMNERSTRKEARVHFFNSFFFTKLSEDGYNYRGVRRWTKRSKTDIFAHRFVMFPVHVGGNHWTLGVINMEKERFQYYDSLGGRNAQFFKLARKYIVDEHKDKKGSTFDISDWEDEIVTSIPSQHNGCDCGVFTIQFADFLSQELPLQFHQNDMGYFRRRMTLQVAEGTL